MKKNENMAIMMLALPNNMESNIVKINKKTILTRFFLLRKANFTEANITDRRIRNLTDE